MYLIQINIPFDQFRIHQSISLDLLSELFDLENRPERLTHLHGRMVACSSSRPTVSSSRCGVGRVLTGDTYGSIEKETTTASGKCVGLYKW